VVELLDLVEFFLPLVPGTMQQWQAISVASRLLQLPTAFLNVENVIYDSHDGKVIYAFFWLKWWSMTPIIKKVIPDSRD
jgi:hypothetical protein